MEKINFFKYHGTGNDFCMVDARELASDILSRDQIAHICHRRFGVGADGLIMLRDHNDLDFEMDYYNADGNRSSMCGNGGRCTVMFAHTLGIIKDSCSFLAIDGEHVATIKEGIVSLKMNDVTSWQNIGDDIVLDTGSPHFVRFSGDIAIVDVVKTGRSIRYSETYEEKGINVNFVNYKENNLEVATYERGVENETYSCGTGVVAAAIASNIRQEKNHPLYKIKTKGGELSVSFDTAGTSITNVWLHGPAVEVYSGSILV